MNLLEILFMGINKLMMWKDRLKQKCLSLILKQQPVASDLRDVSTALKSSY